ncbi:MAG: hypothetical protein JWN52_4457 [Actinomycetia bacterium]|nr:hypothetical protein [Actinomycetes bacterium]
MTGPPAEATLAVIRHGGDLRLFNGLVPLWPEAEGARATGRALAIHFGLPFHFASPGVSSRPSLRGKAHLVEGDRSEADE